MTRLSRREFLRASALTAVAQCGGGLRRPTVDPRTHRRTRS